ncbi:tetratricopeptide repeat protein [bacterium]|nr:tetratricopeptide repeat protein [bacterium]
MRAFLTIVTILLISSNMTYSQELSISDYKIQVEKIGDGIEYILKDYIGDKVVETDYQLQKRFNDAYVLFVLKDYTRASMIFYDIVTKKQYYKEPVFVESLFYLAESFKSLGNYLGAQEYYKQVLSHPTKKYYQDALQQILEISYKIGDFRDIGFYMKEIENSSTEIRPEIYYARGKSAYFEKEYEIAIKSFEQLLKNSKFTLKAQYFIGVCYTALGKYEEALNSFKRVASLEKQSEEDDIIKDQAILSTARIYYTINKTTEAIDAYQDLKRTSSFYDISLYESAWSFVKNKNYEKAIFAVELLIDVLPNSNIIPEAILLKGNLYNEMNQEDKALKSYSEVIGKYSSLSNQLNNIIEHNSNLEEYFSQLLGSDLGSFSAAKFLPPEAVKYVKSEKLVQRAQKIVADLELTKKYLQESLTLLKNLLETLSDDKSVNALFPKAEDARGRTLEYLNQLIKIECKLVEILHREYEKKSGKKDSSFDEISKNRLERIQLSEILNQDIPDTKDGYLKRKENIQKKYSELEQKGYSLSIKISEIKKQIIAMEKLFSENSQKYNYSESKKQLFYDQIEQKKRVISSLEERLSQTSEGIINDKNKVNFVDDANIADENLRKKIVALLKKERDIYSSKGLNRYSDINSIVEKIEKNREKIVGFSENLDKIIRQKANQLKEDVLVEEQDLLKYSQELDKKIELSKNLSAKIALNSFKTVNRKFHEIVLSADVGIIEVAWKNKSKLSDKILDYYSEKSNRTKILENEFKEILGESK